MGRRSSIRVEMAMLARSSPAQGVKVPASAVKVGDMSDKPENWEGRLDALLGDLENLLKTPSVGLSLGSRGVNTSIVLVAVQGLRAYIRGNKAQAADDLATAADELGARLEFARQEKQKLS
jgi:hypothetical protein